ncbi:MAG: adenylate/guanylate cyclase domain-containing protein [Candidatus Sericytochromatia bacterium]|nr:adenylate/guanylate cyclase domain-containing protein [Candidatus Sericytochromatia bacterium]
MNDPHEHLKGSEARLWQLIDARTRAGADTKQIDSRIWDLFGEDWAIMFTDLSGFSRQVAAFGIIHFLQIIHEQKQLMLPIVAQHDGILIKIEADSFLIIFKRAANAITCATALQHACQNVNKRRMPEAQILLCVGIGAGRILRTGDTDVYGQEVNAASKLGEDTAKANEILVTSEAHAKALLDNPDFRFSPLNQAVAGSEINYRLDYGILA